MEVHLSLIVFGASGRLYPISVNFTDRQSARKLLQTHVILSDFRTGDILEIDPQLLDLIYDIRETLDSQGTYEVISAYRSPATNEMLRQRSGSVGYYTSSDFVHIDTGRVRRW